MVVLSFAYPYGAELDTEYYVDTHLPAVREVLASVPYVRMELRKDVSPNQGPYQLTFSIVFASADHLRQFMEHSGIPALQADVAHFYRGTPHVMTEELTVL